MEQQRVIKKARVPMNGGDDIYTVTAYPQEEWATVITIHQGVQTRFEIYPRMFEKSASALMDTELKRWDSLGVGASGRVVKLEEVN